MVHCLWLHRCCGGLSVFNGVGRREDARGGEEKKKGKIYYRWFLRRTVRGREKMCFSVGLVVWRERKKKREERDARVLLLLCRLGEETVMVAGDEGEREREGCCGDVMVVRRRWIRFCGRREGNRGKGRWWPLSGGVGVREEEVGAAARVLLRGKNEECHE
ncbi:hypothetical protein HAX54_041172 [Datura stramonium]|uniref:Uncharacterized protein n=1 Tax=Datura stramonium TaxID=4076 RepID=A0ABS8SKY0_DATST|nr:hypothetical protein [Datura stramonium]